jgi:hypothetical protein
MENTAKNLSYVFIIYRVRISYEILSILELIEWINYSFILLFYSI